MADITGPEPSAVALPRWMCKIIDSRGAAHAVVVLGYVAGAVGVFVKNPWAKVGLIVVGVLCLVAARLLEDRRNTIEAKRKKAAAVALTTARKAAEDAVKDLILVLGDYFEPISGLLARIAGTANRSERRELGGVLMQKVVEATAAISGPSGQGVVRCNYFTLRDEQLVFTTHHGRGEPPRATLPEDALKLALSKRAVLVHDVRTDAPNPQAFVDASYRTFISCSVYSGDTVHGLLTVDAAAPGMLRKRDLRTAVVMSHLLGAGLALQK